MSEERGEDAPKCNFLTPNSHRFVFQFHCFFDNRQSFELFKKRLKEKVGGPVPSAFALFTSVAGCFINACTVVTYPCAFLKWSRKIKITI